MYSIQKSMFCLEIKRNDEKRAAKSTIDDPEFWKSYEEGEIPEVTTDPNEKLNLQDAEGNRIEAQLVIPELTKKMKVFKTEKDEETGIEFKHYSLNGEDDIKDGFLFGDNESELEELLKPVTDEEFDKSLETVHEVDFNLETGEKKVYSWNINEEDEIMKKNNGEWSEYREGADSVRRKRRSSENSEDSLRNLSIADAEEYDENEKRKRVEEAADIVNAKSLRRAVRNLKKNQSIKVVKKKNSGEDEKVSEKRRGMSKKVEELIMKVVCEVLGSDKVVNEIGIDVVRIEGEEELDDVTVIWSFGHRLLDINEKNVRENVCNRIESRLEDLREHILDKLQQYNINLIRMHFRQAGKPTSEMESIFARIRAAAQLQN
eukprot:CAMPEP_0182442274 /NCGR_PEP_ID=MMETSP1172-20130603/1208_1 /TAXON_ID=708627 /ORGANISM="Timspurckia oligopyrenoides, Strain CCMP3278" /LENGTH=374 /DNA_ID=CAMNT_0024637041 /DNA_START=505 /DNA_END=1630 /DNA_ORIENTATION=+